LLFKELPNEMQGSAKKAFKLFSCNPRHPSLAFKPLKCDPHFWSVRIGLRYRAVGSREGDTVKWFWIGSHAEFDKKFS
jgi:hypothetical protein